MAMENQYCKVGAITPVKGGRKGIQLLESLYNHFIQKASEVAHSDTHLSEFFEQKAQKIQRMLQGPV